VRNKRRPGTKWTPCLRCEGCGHFPSKPPAKAGFRESQITATKTAIDEASRLLGSGLETTDRAKLSTSLPANYMRQKKSFASSRFQINASPDALRNRYWRQHQSASERRQQHFERPAAPGARAVACGRAAQQLVLSRLALKACECSNPPPYRGWSAQALG
jgi:hypothetical protein